MKIIRDTREKVGKGWLFKKEKVEIVERALKTGDYSIEGLEDKICIERKGSVSEWAGNVTSKRFLAELQRMKDGGMTAYIFLEFSPEELLKFPPPYLKRRGVKVSGHFLMKRTLEFEQEYGVRVMFVGSVGEKMAAYTFFSFTGPEAA